MSQVQDQPKMQSGFQQSYVSTHEEKATVGAASGQRQTVQSKAINDQVKPAAAAKKAPEKKPSIENETKHSDMLSLKKQVIDEIKGEL